MTSSTKPCAYHCGAILNSSNDEVEPCSPNGPYMRNEEHTPERCRALLAEKLREHNVVVVPTNEEPTGKHHCGDPDKCTEDPYSTQWCDCDCETRCGPWNEYLGGIGDRILALEQAEKKENPK